MCIHKLCIYVYFPGGYLYYYRGAGNLSCVFIFVNFSCGFGIRVKSRRIYILWMFESFLVFLYGPKYL